MKKLLFSLLIAGTSLAASAQFQKVFDLNDDYGNIMIQAPSGPTIVGSTNKVGAGGYDNLLMHFSSNGTLAWQKQYGTAGTENGRNVIKTDYGYVLTGSTTSGGIGNGTSDVSLIKVDDNGVLQWAKSYGSDSTETGYAVTQATDGGYIITGQSKAYGQGGNDLLLIKTDSNGVIRWSHTYGTSADDVGYFVTQDGDGSIIAVGHSGAGGQGRNDIYVVNTDSLGVVQNQLLIGGGGDEDGRFVSFANNQLFIAGTEGSTGQNKMFVMALNVQSGISLAWAKVYGGNTGQSQLGSFANISGTTNFLLTGQTSSFGNSNGSNGLVIQIDTLGDAQWATVVGDSGNTYLSGGYRDGSQNIISGSTNFFGRGSNSDVYLASTTTSGTLCKNARSANITVATWTPTVLGPVLNTHRDSVAALVENIVTMSENTYTPTEQDICALFPALVVADAGSDTTICESGHATLGGTNTASGGSGTYTYLWSPTTGLSSATIANPVTTAIGTTSYTVTVTDNAGQSATSTVVVTVDTIRANLNLNHSDTICVNASPLTLTTSPTGGTLTGLGITGNILDPSVAGPGDDTIRYTVSDLAGCSSSTRRIMHIDAPQIVAISINSPDTICTTASPITLTASPAGGTFSGSGVTGSTLTPSAAAVGVDTITYTRANGNDGCVSTGKLVVTVQVCTGINDVEGTPISVYPNPSNGTFVIDLGTVTNTNTEVRIYDLSGATVYASKVADSKVSLSLNLASGSYLLQVINADHSVFHKLSIQ